MEVSIDNLMVSKTDDVVNSEDGRCFDLSDAIAVAGFQSEADQKPLPVEDGIQLHYDKQTITIKKNGDIEIGGTAVQALVNESFLTAYDQHTHSSPAGGSTGVPVVTSLPTHKTSKTKAE